MNCCPVSLFLYIFFLRGFLFGIGIRIHEVAEDGSTWIRIHNTAYTDCLNSLYSSSGGRNVLGEDEPQVPHLLQRGHDGEGQQLLQDVHLLDQREDPQNLCGPQHVRLSSHQVV